MRVNLRYKGQYIQVQLNVKELVVIGLGVGSAFVVDKLWQEPPIRGYNTFVVFLFFFCPCFVRTVPFVSAGFLTLFIPYSCSCQLALTSFKVKER